MTVSSMRRFTRPVRSAAGKHRSRAPAAAATLALAVVATLAACAKPAEDPDRGKPGRAEYLGTCAACHGRRGLGTKNLFPPLAGSDWAQGPPELPIRIVLHGLEGPVTVQGERYLNLMPPLGKRFTDEQIARVLTYVRSAFGNSAPPIDAATVAAVRARTGGRDKPWQAGDLEPLMEPTSAAPDAGEPARAE